MHIEEARSFWEPEPGGKEAQHRGGPEQTNDAACADVLKVAELNR
jgi:hypothetical protein